MRFYWSCKPARVRSVPVHTRIVRPADIARPVTSGVIALVALVASHICAPVAHAFGCPCTITTVAGTGEEGYDGDGGPAVGAQLSILLGLAMDQAGNLYVADGQRVRKIDGAGVVETVAGEAPGSAQMGGASSTQIPQQIGLAIDAAGNLYMTGFDHRVRRVDPAGVIATVAGTGVAGYGGDGGAATSARLNWPWGVATDAVGNLYVTDSANHRVRRIDPTGVITTIAGTGLSGYSGDGGSSVLSQLSQPTGVAVDTSGNLYVADTGNNRVRKIDSAGVITTVAGTGASGYSGDGGSAVHAQLNMPSGLAVDAVGNLYVADNRNHSVRRIDPAGVVTTVAGTGVSGYSGDGGPASAAQLASPVGLAVDERGNLYIADSANRRVRKVTPQFADDHGDVASSATHLDLNSSQRGIIEYSGDVDYFRLETSGRRAVRVWTTGSVDTLGLLLDREGELVALDDDSGGGENFSIEATVSAGVYFVRVAATGSTTGRYVIRESGRPAPFVSQAVTVVLGGSGESVELVTVEGGGYTLGGQRFESGTVVRTSGGHTYRLDFDGTQWMALWVPESFMVVLGASGTSVELETLEQGGFRRVGGSRVLTSGREPVVRQQASLYLVRFSGHHWEARFVRETFWFVLGASGESVQMETLDGGDPRIIDGSRVRLIEYGFQASNGDVYVVTEDGIGRALRWDGRRFILKFLPLPVELRMFAFGRWVIIHEDDLPLKTAEGGGYSWHGSRIEDSQWGEITFYYENYEYRLDLGADGKPVAVFVHSRLTNSLGMGLLRIKAPRPFYIGAWEVTQGEWVKVMGNNPSHFRNCGADCPVESVNINDVQAFLEKLNATEFEGEGSGYRLPTESEWQHVAYNRAIVPRPTDPWCKENSDDMTHPVATDLLALQGMYGNVSEWTASQGLTSEARVVRGGSWQHLKTNPESSFYSCWTGARQELRSDFRAKHVGFRVLLEAPEPVGTLPVDDHGNDRASATTVRVGSTTPGRIDPPGDIDFFRFETALPMEVSVSTRGTLARVGSLLDESGRVLVGDRYALNISIRIDPGEYWIRVRSWDLDRTGNYELLLNGVSIPVGGNFRDCNNCPEMVTVPGGIFRMGSPLTEHRRDDREGPMSYVQIGDGNADRGALAVGRYEVTREQYLACVDAGSCRPPRAATPSGDPRNDRSTPVEGVSWRDANAYCEWLSARTSKQYRLPTEAEWEYAARAGTQTAYFWGDRINHRFARYDDWRIPRWGTSYWIAFVRDKASAVGQFEQPSPVGRYPPNAFGLYDMHGNVWEWTATCANSRLNYEYFDGDGSPSNFDCGNRGASRVSRGGGYNWTARDARAARRGFDNPDQREDGLGFRVVRELAPGP